MSVNTFQTALVVEGEYISAWQHQMLVRLLASGCVRLRMVVFRQPVVSTLRQRVNAMLLSALHYVDGKLFKCPATARQPISFLPLLEDVIVCDADSLRYRRLLQQQTLDVVIDLSEQAPLPDLVKAAKYGVWRHFFGDAFDRCDRYTGIREYAHQQAEILSGIERWTAGNTVCEYIFAATTSTDVVSINRGVERTLWKMVDFIPQRLQELLNLGEQRFVQNVHARMQPVALVQSPKLPDFSVVLTLKVLWRYPHNFVKKLAVSLFRAEQWILLSKVSGQAVQAGGLEQFRKWLPPRDRFWADPFVVEYAGEQYVFFEELIYARGIGHLACVRLNADGSHSEPVTILEKPYHLSYPFVFQHQGDYFMIPETADNRAIEVYRCEAFPHRWVFEKNLMTGVEAYDTTLMEYEGQWWLFASMRHDYRCSPNEALYLFYADHPLSTQWQPHPQNPVVASAARARPAGRIFKAAGQWYRPSQNCAGTYGRGLNINRIEQLDVNTYREELVSSYLPNGQHDMNGMHTLGVSSPVSVADAVHVHRRLGMLDRLVVKLNRFFSQPLVISS